MQNKINAIRSFNRRYTNILGLLDKDILDSDYSLSQVRVLHEIDKLEQCTSKYLSDTLCMDSGYLSRMLAGFEKSGLCIKQKSSEDGRIYNLSLTNKGKKTMEVLNLRSNEQIFSLINPLCETERSNLVKAMTTIESILTQGKNVKLDDIRIRHNIKPGDIGYITYMHGWIYRMEYGYSTAFESYVAQTFCEFLSNYKAGYDRLWIGEHNEKIVGSIGIVGHKDKAQLRWFLLDPNYRGIGLGKKLLQTAVNFSKETNYKSIYLDTTSDLDKALGMYQKMGFTKVFEKENHSWKDDLLELRLSMDL